jgi:negative regulator of replication initiation
LSKTITVSNEVYAAIVARRQSKDESENDILNHILSTAGTTAEIHAHAHKSADDAHLILDSEMDHTLEKE